MSKALTGTVVVLLWLAVAPAANGDEIDVELGGHVKGQLLAQWFGDESLYAEVAGRTAVDAGLALRSYLAVRRGRFSLRGDYQLLGARSELLPAGLRDDDARLLDLTHPLHEGGDTDLRHRLDRLWIGYTGERTAVRLGRQALSWGNGLFFSPLDLVNPFDPAAVDTEYKAGDDMLYGQYLFSNGGDLQAAIVARRDPLSGDVDRALATIAVKYHGFVGGDEFDVLLADNRDARVLGLGATRSIGGAIVRADLAVTDDDGETRTEALANLSYSWVAMGRNLSGALEYYHDGEDGHYLAGSLLVEVSPLLSVTPTLLARADEPSALLQFVTRYSLGDDFAFLGSVNVPLGPAGSGYGGSESPLPGRYLSFDAAVFAQLAWYF